MRHLAVLGLLLAALPARADFITVSLAGNTNSDIRTYANGVNYPIAPTTLTVGGVPFDLVPNGAAPDSLGVFQTNTVGSSDPSSITLTTSVFGATSVYTLINSAFGAFGANNGSLTFTSLGGLSATFDLTQGVNVRDHFNNVFNNIINDPNVVTADFGGGVRLDRQRFDLPAGFASDTLTGITFTGPPPGQSQGDGLPFLAGVTVEQSPPVGAVPAPPAAALLLVGLPGLLLARRRSAGRACSEQTASNPRS